MRQASKHCTWQLTRLKPRAPTIITVCTMHLQTCHSLEASSSALLHTSYQTASSVQCVCCAILHEHPDWEIQTIIPSILILGCGRRRALAAESSRTDQLSGGQGIFLSLCVCVCLHFAAMWKFMDVSHGANQWNGVLHCRQSGESLWVKATKAF